MHQRGELRRAGRQDRLYTARCRIVASRRERRGPAHCAVPAGADASLRRYRGEPAIFRLALSAPAPVVATGVIARDDLGGAEVQSQPALPFGDLDGIPITAGRPRSGRD
jgi:hypothetical protein